jgi:hypothetical protein
MGVLGGPTARVARFGAAAAIRRYVALGESRQLAGEAKISLSRPSAKANTLTGSARNRRRLVDKRRDCFLRSPSLPPLERSRPRASESEAAATELVLRQHQRRQAYERSASDRSNASSELAAVRNPAGVVRAVRLASRRRRRDVRHCHFERQFCAAQFRHRARAAS